MLIKTALAGEQNIDPDTVIEFPKGLPGFDDCARFKLFHQDGGEPLVYWLQSLDRPEVVFSVAEPAHFGIHYEITLGDDETALLGETDDMLVLILLYKDEQGQGTPVKGLVKSPLILNTKTRRGLQKVLCDIEPSVTVRDDIKTVEFKAH